jgi:hypothetical protein
VGPGGEEGVAPGRGVVALHLPASLRSWSTPGRALSLLLLGHLPLGPAELMKRGRLCERAEACALPAHSSHAPPVQLSRQPQTPGDLNPFSQLKAQVYTWGWEPSGRKGLFLSIVLGDGWKLSNQCKRQTHRRAVPRPTRVSLVSSRPASSLVKQLAWA